MDETQQRVADLERRVALLENVLFPKEKNVLNEIPAPNRSTSLVEVDVSNKRFAPKNPSLGDYEDHIWFDVVYKARALNKPTRALKGVLCFADIFGEVKLRINVTVNERLEPGRPLAQHGIGYTYNQFMPEHQWMFATKEADMKASFLATNVIYADGSSEEFR